MAVRRTIQLFDGEGNFRSLANLEAEIIAAAVKRCGSLTDAAATLGIARTTLYNKLRAYGITPEGEVA